MKNIYKCLLGLFIMVVTGNFATAQNYSISPAKTLTVTAPAEEVTIFDIFMNNTTSHKLSLSWKVISNQLLPGWDYSMCDLGTCYVIVPNSATMIDSVDVGDKGFLGLNVNPFSISGAGKYVMYVYETSDSVHGDTLTWIVNSGTSGTSITLLNERSFSVYPNPAQNILNISMPVNYKAGRAEIWSAAGSILIEQNISVNQAVIDISQLPAGVYFTRLLSADGIESFRKFIKSN